jgi:superoxide dismutase, Fe-Mn family
MSQVKNYGQDVESWIIEVTSYLERNNRMEQTVFTALGRLSQLAHQLQTEEATEEDMQRLEMELAHTYREISEWINQDSERYSANAEQSVPIGEHTLPPLLYPYDALEPVISEEIMYLHHDKHHQAYVDGLNKAEKMMKQARETNDFALLKHWEREAAFHGSGHYLHTLFWEGMSPNGGGQPKGLLLKQVEQDFGSLASFKKHFSEAAKQVEAVGWAILVWVPRARRLEILQSERHMILTQWDTIPILVLDVWEHAYYLQYKNNRAAYVDQWWNIVNWPQTERRFLESKKLIWTAY